VGAWAVLGSIRPGYSPIDDAISRLAAIGAPHRWWMEAGFVAFGIAIPLYARALRVAVPGWAWVAATVTGLATLGVAAAPLGRADGLHAVFATIGYASLAAAPLLAAPRFRSAGRRRWAVASVAAGAVSALLLAASTVAPHHGFTQRAGLGAVDAWIVATAWVMWRTGRLLGPSGAVSS